MLVLDRVLHPPQVGGSLKPGTLPANRLGILPYRLRGVLNCIVSGVYKDVDSRDDFGDSSVTVILLLLASLRSKLELAKASLNHSGRVHYTIIEYDQ